MALYTNNPESELIPAQDGDEYKRTHTKMVVDNGDAPSGKWLADPRLPKLFKYQFGGQNGYVTIPKGRIVALAPDKEFKDFEDNKYYNALTIANGGEDVTERNDNPELDEPGSENYTRVANKPVGVAQLNVYKNHEDSFKGNNPSFITRNTINLPYFLDQSEAEKMDWGSAYGNNLKPGDKVMSDENGRFVKWEENQVRKEVFSGDGSQSQFQVKAAIHPDVEPADITVIDTETDTKMTVNTISHTTGDIQLNSAPNAGTDNVEVTYTSILSDDLEQKVGQIVNIDRNMIPAGWLQWVQTEQPLPNGEEEDPTGFEAKHLDDKEGYPYDKQYRDGYADDETRPTGIEGLTDGSALTKEIADEQLGEIPSASETGDRYNFHTIHTPMVDGTLKIELKDSTGTVVADSDTNDLVDFVNEEEGLVILELDFDPAQDLDVVATYDATGQYPGLPSNLNWEGVAGSVDVLLQL